MGLNIKKVSVLGGFESIHDGFFSEIRYQPIETISISASFIEATGWADSETGVSRSDGFALSLGIKF